MVEPLTAGVIGFVLGLVVGIAVAMLLGGIGEFGLFDLLELVD